MLLKTPRQFKSMIDSVIVSSDLQTSMLWTLGRERCKAVSRSPSGGELDQVAEEDASHTRNTEVCCEDLPGMPGGKTHQDDLPISILGRAQPASQRGAGQT